MKICIKENNFNPTLLEQQWATEQIAHDMGYTIVEIPDECYDCAFGDFNNDFTFNTERYTVRKAKEKLKEEILPRIAELKGLLQETDYKAIKFAEGEISAEEYEETKLQRKAWRDEINQLEEQLRGA